ncbi:MAG: hypothetical protein JW738_07550 [Actinobacteria bacterium]|nr:hypothetical protein [Actinomycetota bacterium]
MTDEKIKIFIRNPHHPSLRSKRVAGTKKIWESSVNMNIRFTWQYEGKSSVILRNIDKHDEALKKP